MIGREELLRLAEVVECRERLARHDVDREWAREANERIASAIGLPLTQRLGDPALGNERTVPTRISDYVGSLDAAISLVPKGWYWRVDQGRNAGGAMFEVDGYRQLFTLAETPALALVSAALRARAAMMEEG